MALPPRTDRPGHVPHTPHVEAVALLESESSLSGMPPDQIAFERESRESAGRAGKPRRSSQTASAIVAPRRGPSRPTLQQPAAEARSRREKDAKKRRSGTPSVATRLAGEPKGE